MRPTAPSARFDPAAVAVEDDLWVRPDAAAETEMSDWDSATPRVDATLNALRDDFVDAFNDRDLDAVQGLCRADVECPDLPGDGFEVLADELTAVWERSPGVVLTRAVLDDELCAMAWLPDDEGRWSRAAVVRFVAAGDLLALVTVSDDVGALPLATATTPEGTDPLAWLGTSAEHEEA
ncbi:hypothetical protein ER308_07630 [Egibacter rhizosphaerae]|uniref:Nuclear transport factor 2 family protein n=1 Tax=Egibacter rhizosphaerae TaxID=1670831 RepID=A0A411YE24_9ACTN|nr:hypothetical protein [Egibacter rhizosphaerae]QBI19436.1 hypothetical protein ER308_07630 [Egibacter rhizosphaerae]